MTSRRGLQCGLLRNEMTRCGKHCFVNFDRLSIEINGNLPPTSRRHISHIFRFLQKIPNTRAFYPLLIEHDFLPSDQTAAASGHGLLILMTFLDDRETSNSTWTGWDEWDSISRQWDIKPTLFVQLTFKICKRALGWKGIDMLVFTTASHSLECKGMMMSCEKCYQWYTVVIC